MKEMPIPADEMYWYLDTAVSVRCCMPVLASVLSAWYFLLPA